MERRAGFGCRYTTWVISTIMLFENSKSTKELKGTTKLKDKTIVYVAMWPLVMYSNYFKIASTVAITVSHVHLLNSALPVNLLPRLLISW